MKNLQLAEERSAGGARGRKRVRHGSHFCEEEVEEEQAENETLASREKEREMER